MATIYIDNQPHQVKDGQNLLHACLSLGFDIPYFCWHPALHSVGACRQCAVKLFKDEHDTVGRIVMSCMTPAKDGTRISIDDEQARAFRRSIIELLMTNHPHDCPVCDEGGECHLQDMTVMTGHDTRRFRFEKRTYPNQDLGPFVTHEMNRCIQCYRCTRFYNDYAGGRDFGVFGWHDHVYFGRHADGPLQSEFSGNLVEVCPTGVFTDKTLARHYTRKWDLQTAPSVCVNCGVGCNTLPGERYGGLRRIRNRFNGQVNRYFLCDRGRYGYEFVNSPRRVRTPLVVTNGHQEPIAADRALARAADMLRSGKAIGIGSPRASLESNFALRQLVGKQHFFAGVGAESWRLQQQVLRILVHGPCRSPSLHDVEQADAVLLLGEDITNVAPMIALALRQAVRHKPMEEAIKRCHLAHWDDAAIREAVQNQKGPLFIASPHATKLDDVAAATFRGAPDDLARLGAAIAHALAPEAPAPQGLDQATEAMAQQIALALQQSKRPLVVTGASLLSGALLEAAANVALALVNAGRPARLCVTAPQANSVGLALTDAPGLDGAIDALASGAADTIVILENDLYHQAAAPWVDQLLALARQVIVLDHIATPTSERAHLVLPAATFAESTGTLVNSEGRAQRFFEVFVPGGDIRPAWRWLAEIDAARSDTPPAWDHYDAVLAAMAEAMPQFAPAVQAAPAAGFTVCGQKVARQPARYSGRTAMHADVEVSEASVPADPDTPLSYSMEGFQGPGQPPSLVPRFWSPGWNSVQALAKFQTEVGGPLQGGEPGQRLIEQLRDQAEFFPSVPAAFSSRPGQWLVLPAYHIYGSEELSMLTPGVAARAPQPYLAMHPEDARSLQLHEGGRVSIALGESTVVLPLILRPDLPRGVALAPQDLPSLGHLALPAWAAIAPSGELEELGP